MEERLLRRVPAEHGTVIDMFFSFENMGSRWFLRENEPVGLRLRRDVGYERGHCVLGDMVYTLLSILLHIMVFGHDGGKRGRTARGNAWGTVWA